MQSMETLIARLRKYMPNADFSLLLKAYEFAAGMHRGQHRNSGEPFIIHPLEVAYILADMDLDLETVIAGILHDVIEDTSSSYEQIKAEFGDEIAALVEGVTKLDQIQFITREEQQVENLRKMFLAMAKDIRVVLIKLADRLHNMRTLKSMNSEKQLLKARETLEVYAPLAHRLGIFSIKWELEDQALRHLDSVAYHEISESIRRKKAERDEYIEKIKQNLAEKLADLNISAQIEGRAKHFYSIFKKMYAQDKTIDEIYDLFAVRIIVDTVNDCYAALGMVHEQYKPIPGRFKDYIAMPKQNMYQSLHTTVIGPEGSPFEIQIRTEQMHKTAEYGIAAHWKYKESKSLKDDADLKFAWVRQLLEIQKDLHDSEDFISALKVDLFADEVFVFTPRGDVINLPVGSTPIDFAFAIHSAVGYRMIGAKVNKKIAPLDYKLETGDIVDILTSSTIHGPKRDWLKIAKTSQAKSKINTWFRRENRTENIQRGKDQIERELKKQGATAAELFKPEFTDVALRRYGFNSLDDMYAAIGFGGLTAQKLVTRLKDLAGEEAKALLPPELPSQTGAPKTIAGGIEVKGIDNCLVRISRCCTPLPGDKIVGFITRGRGVSVHRADCVNVRADKMDEEGKNRLIECSWVGGGANTYLSELAVEASDRTGILADITNVVSESKIRLHALNARTTRERTAFIQITLELSDTKQLDMVIKKLHNIPGIYKVTRSQQ